MARVKIDFNKAGFRQLLTSASARSELRKHGRRIREGANAIPSTTAPAATEPYYEMVDGPSEDRARVRVQTTSSRAVRHERKTQALLRNL